MQNEIVYAELATGQKLGHRGIMKAPDCERGHDWNAEETYPEWMEQPDADSEIRSCLKCGLWHVATASGDNFYSRPREE